MTTLSRRFLSASPSRRSWAFHVAVGGVEEVDAQIDGALHGRDLHLVVALAEARGGAARAQADGGDRRPVLSQFAVVHQSALMPAAWMSGVQRASSAFTQSRSSSGVEDAAATPCFRNVSCVCGARRISPISPFSLLTIAFGVFAGANRPNQSFASMPGMPASTALGMSGAPGKRVALDTAKAFTLPALSWAYAVSGERNETGTSPESTAVSA